MGNFRTCTGLKKKTKIQYENSLKKKCESLNIGIEILQYEKMEHVTIIMREYKKIVEEDIFSSFVFDVVFKKLATIYERRLNIFLDNNSDFANLDDYNDRYTSFIAESVLALSKFVSSFQITSSNRKLQKLCIEQINYCLKHKTHILNNENTKKLESFKDSFNQNGAYIE
jgi:hypothetical protein